jgi:hypothetical protein
MENLAINDVRLMNSADQFSTSDSFQLKDFPALASLGVTACELNELASQGFVNSEQRRYRIHFKLRFRRSGLQTTKYIANASLAADVRKELDRLQAATNLRRRLNAARMEAKHRLREAKRVLAPLLQARGFKFHGRTIRQSRLAKAPPSK